MIILEYITIILIAISLSIDAFSVSVSYGLLNIKKENIIITSILVGLFHFFMPLLGLKIGYIISTVKYINTNLILVLVLFIIGLEMLKSINENEIPEKRQNFLESLIFAFLVSIDSFFIGVGLNAITTHTILASIFFSIFSFSLTLTGFLLGKYITKKSKKQAKIIGIFIIFTLIIYFLCK